MLYSPAFLLLSPGPNAPGPPGRTLCKVNADTKEEKMVRLTDSNEEEVHAKIRRAYEDAMKMEEQERAEKQTISYIEVGLVFLAGFVSALILTAYNC